jgi:hypothetical protein
MERLVNACKTCFTISALMKAHSKRPLRGLLQLALKGSFGIAFVASALAQDCRQIGGLWEVEEHTTIKYRVSGQTSSTQSDQTGLLPIQQTGCGIQFESEGVNPTDGSIIQLARHGMVTGSNVTYTGEAGVIIPGATYSENYINGTGVIVGNTMLVTNVGMVRASVQGISVVVTISGTAVFTRSGPLASISGEVQFEDPAGDPVPDVTVTLTSGTFSVQEVQTDDMGAYAFDGLTPGTYTVVPRKSGFVFEPRNQIVDVIGDTRLPVFIASQVPQLKITSMWSSQVTGTEFCSLPSSAAAARGAGTWGNFLNIILMGASTDDKAHVSCSISIAPDNFRDSLVLRLVQVDGGGVLADANITGDLATFTADILANVTTCTIEGWIDLDHNGLFNPEAGEVLVRAPGEFVIISRQEYNAAISALRSRTGFAGLVLPIAYRLLDSFLDNTTPEHGVDNGLVPVSPVEDLDHNAGVDFDIIGRALVHEYEFPANSDVASKVLASDAMRRLVTQAIAGNSSAIQEAFDDPLTTEITIPVLQGTTFVPIEFRQPDDLILSEWDLYYAFHAAQIYDCSVTLTRDSDVVSLAGILADTYDFRWNVGELSALASRVQAGFPTLGMAGEVYRVKVVLAGDVQGVRYDLNPALALGALTTRVESRLANADTNSLTEQRALKSAQVQLHRASAVLTKDLNILAAVAATVDRSFVGDVQFALAEIDALDAYYADVQQQASALELRALELPPRSRRAVSNQLVRVRTALSTAASTNNTLASRARAVAVSANKLRTAAAIAKAAEKAPRIMTTAQIGVSFRTFDGESVHGTLTDDGMYNLENTPGPSTESGTWNYEWSSATTGILELRPVGSASYFLTITFQSKASGMITGAASDGSIIVSGMFRLQ